MQRAPAICLGLLTVSMLAGCVAPARSFAAYEGKAADSSATALSAVRSAALTAEVAGRAGLLATVISINLQNAETGARTARDTFGSIQPPDADSDQLRAELTPLLDQASEGLARMRIAARRNDVAAVVAIAASLEPVAQDLERFEMAHAS